MLTALATHGGFGLTVNTVGDLEVDCHHTVEDTRKTHGSNQLTQKKRNGFFRQFLASFGDPIIKILLAALAINLIFLFRDFNWYETVGIAVAIFLATFVSTLSEYGSESAFLKLQEDAQKIKCRGVVDEYIQTPEGRHRLVHHIFDRFLVAHVHLYGQSPRSGPRKTL